MAKVTSQVELLEEIDAEHAALVAMIDATPRELWRTSSVNSAGWNLKDVVAHVADWAERCDAWCGLGDSLREMTPPAKGFKWNETRELNAAIYQARRSHALDRVLKDFHAAHAALRRRAEVMNEDDLLAVGRFWLVRRDVERGQAHSREHRGARSMGEQAFRACAARSGRSSHPSKGPQKGLRKRCFVVLARVCSLRDD